MGFDDTYQEKILIWGRGTRERWLERWRGIKRLRGWYNTYTKVTRLWRAVDVRSDGGMILFLIKLNWKWNYLERFKNERNVLLVAEFVSKWLSKTFLNRNRIKCASFNEDRMVCDDTLLIAHHHTRVADITRIPYFSSLRKQCGHANRDMVNNKSWLQRLEERKCVEFFWNG